MNLLMLAGWNLTNTTNSPLGTFSGEVNGMNYVRPNSAFNWNVGDPTSDNDRLIGTVSWDITGFMDFGEIWFHIINRSTGTSVFSVPMYQVELLSGPGTATFDVPSSLWMEIKTSGDEFDFDIGINSYDNMGTFTVVGTPDVVVPPPEPEPTQLPWWYCVPKVPVVCPVRASGFVPLAEYDADFKFPVASSRVASKIQPTAGSACQPCTPTLITAPVVVVPPVEPEPVVCASGLLDNSEGGTLFDLSGMPDWFTNGVTPNFLLRWTHTIDGVLTGLYSNFDGSLDYAGSNVSGFNNGSTNYEVAENISVEDRVWTCINLEPGSLYPLPV